VRRINNLLAALLAAVLITSTGCGVSDSVKSILLTSNSNSTGGTYNLVGVDGTLQLKVFAIYHSGKQVDVTNNSTFTMVPTGCTFSGDVNNPCGGDLPTPGPDTVTINKTGMMTGVVPVCTWLDIIDTSKTPPAPANPPIWEYTGFYQTTATYNGLASQPVGIGLGGAASNSPIGGCGPQ
jgi:hypothetical protein